MIKIIFKKFIFKFIAAILCFCTIFLHFPSFFGKQNHAKIATAEVVCEYARVLNEKTPFYSDPNCKILKFYLPYSYFVRIIKIGSETTRVIYMENSIAPAREGYVKTGDLYICDYLPENPYPNLKLTLKNDEILFSNPSNGETLVVLSAGEYAYYYDETQTGGDSFYYVYSGTYVGYVRKEAFLAHSLSLHSKELPPEEQPKTDPPEQSSSSSFNQSTSESGKSDNGLVSAVVIIAVSLITVSVIYALFRPERKTFKRAAYSEDEEEKY